MGTSTATVQSTSWQCRRRIPILLNPPSAYLLPLWGRCHPQRRWGGRSTGGAGIGRKGLSESTSLDPRPATFHRRPPSAAELRAVIPGSRNMGGVIPRSRRLQCRRSRPSYVDYGPTFAIWPFHQLENPCFERATQPKNGEKPTDIPPSSWGRCRRRRRWGPA